MMKKNEVKGYLFLIPVLLLVAVFLFYPFLRGAYISFFKTKYGYGDMQFYGLNNYIKVLQDQFFGTALKNSLIWVVVCTALNMIIPTAIALLMNHEFRGKQVATAAILIPWLTPVVGLAMMFKWILEPEVGVLNTFLQNAGLVETGINFIGSTTLAFPVLMLLNCFQFCPFGVLLNLSALSTISEDLYEAMRIDGASNWDIFKKLILPSISKMVGFLMFLGIVWAFSSYSLIYIMTKGGPSYSTFTIPIMIYEKAFQNINVGRSTALATLTGVVMIILGFLYFKFMYKTDDE